MGKELKADKERKVLPLIVMALGIILFAVQLLTRQNLIAVVNLIYLVITSVLVFLGILLMKKVYAYMLTGYGASLAGLILFHIIFGADAGFGALTSGKAGWSSAEHTLAAGGGSLFTRLTGNILLSLPLIIPLVLLYFSGKRNFKSGIAKKLTCAFLSFVLIGSTVYYVLFMNMRSKPVTERMWDGHDDYLNSIEKNAQGKPNVLVILMDDLGYGDVGLNGAIYDTPNIDSIGENGLNFENYYSSYSVCSPARFAALTGRYPYRGYADNVIYPTFNCTSPFAQTRIFNSIEMLNNTDGMLGDEITIAETFKAAGYNTGIFGKWHLGDYGEYLPTNQGFDYFYGGHSVNDMKPFYHVREENGEYTIAHGTDELKDQSDATRWIHDEITAWITDKVTNSDEPFLAYYTTPWPHAPVFAGDDFDGISGMGTYVDCVTEFDTYLGKLFDTLEELGVLEDTIIVFTSDNGPALEGSTGELRGGKYLAYEGGQKVPFMIRWDNNGGLFEAGGTREQASTLVDLYPTLTELCGIKCEDNPSSLPQDRVIDGVSMLPLLKDDTVIHTPEHPILYMKRRKLKAISYTVPTSSIKEREEYRSYNYDVLNDNDYITFKYFKNIQNDNSAFFDKYRKNWLHILTDDAGENYNRTPVYPTVSEEMNKQLTEIQKDFESNPRGMIK